MVMKRAYHGTPMALKRMRPGPVAFVREKRPVDDAEGGGGDDDGEGWTCGLELCGWEALGCAADASGPTAGGRMAFASATESNPGEAVGSEEFAGGGACLYDAK